MSFQNAPILMCASEHCREVNTLVADALVHTVTVRLMHLPHSGFISVDY